MFCTKCGTQFEGNFCPNCGTGLDKAAPEPTASKFEMPNVSFATPQPKAPPVAKRKMGCATKFTVVFTVVFTLIALIFFIIPGKKATPAQASAGSSTAVSSSNLMDGGINAVLGVDADPAFAAMCEPLYKNVALPKDVTISISGVQIKLVPSC